MPEIVEFLLVAGLVYYGIRALIRFLLPMLFQGLVNKAQQQGQQQYTKQYNNSNQSRTNEGSVRVDKVPNTKSAIPDTEGDYVDYEEIK